MRKLIIAYILSAAVLFAGCAKETSHTETKKHAAGTEPNITEATNKMDKEFEDKVKAIDEIGQEVIENIRTEASKAISEIKKFVPTTVETAKTETTLITTSPAPKEITLNKVVNSPIGDVTIAYVKINYQYKSVDIYFVPPERSTRPTRLDGSPIIIRFTKDSTCTDKNGNELKLVGHGGDGKYIYLYFEYPENADLSELTLTYAFEGYDPVTVTFDIPGL